MKLTDRFAVKPSKDKKKKLSLKKEPFHGDEV